MSDGWRLMTSNRCCPVPHPVLLPLLLQLLLPKDENAKLSADGWMDGWLVGWFDGWTRQGWFRNGKRNLLGYSNAMMAIVCSHSTVIFELLIRSLPSIRNTPKMRYNCIHLGLGGWEGYNHEHKTQHQPSQSVDQLLLFLPFHFAPLNCISD